MRTSQKQQKLPQTGLHMPCIDHYRILRTRASMFGLGVETTVFAIGCTDMANFFVNNPSLKPPEQMYMTALHV